MMRMISRRRFLAACSARRPAHGRRARVASRREVLGLGRLMHWAAAVAVLLTLLVLAATSQAATVAKEEAVPDDGSAEPRPVPDSEITERVIVDPEPNWGDWGDIDDSFYHYHPGGLRIDTWVDRGEWATYEPGDRLWVYFRVNKPCYVTILDYTTDGRVETIYPNRWSGARMAYPGRVYRVPDDGRFSLRIAGPEGIETLVACAHELPWPSGHTGSWTPRYHRWIEPRSRTYVAPWGVPPGRVIRGSDRSTPAPRSAPEGRVVPGEGGRVAPQSDQEGRVIVGGDSRRDGRVIVGGDSRGGRRVVWGPPRGRVVVGPDWWPVPEPWHTSPGRWACDSVTFRVASRYGDDWGGDWWYGGDSQDDWGDDDWYGDGYGRPLMHERFRMSTPRDSMHETFRFDDERVHVRIDCVADRKNDPTEIVGRIGWFGGWGDETIFRIDVSGRNGIVPREGDVYTAFTGPIRVDVEVVDLRLARVRPWQLPRIEWIKFEVKAYAR